MTGEPSLLLFRGAYLPAALRRARVREEEVRAAVRFRGLLAIEEVEAVVLETDGSFSVIGRGNGHPPSSLAGIEIPHQHSRTTTEDRNTGDTATLAGTESNALDGAVFPASKRPVQAPQPPSAQRWLVNAPHLVAPAAAGCRLSGDTRYRYSRAAPRRRDRRARGA